MYIILSLIWLKLLHPSGLSMAREVRMGENALVEMPFTVTINTGASWTAEFF